MEYSKLEYDDLLLKVKCTMKQISDVLEYSVEYEGVLPVLKKLEESLAFYHRRLYDIDNARRDEFYKLRRMREHGWKV